MKRKGITIILIALFATILWGFVSLSEEYFYKIKAKIRFVDLPEGYDIASVTSDEIEISLRGKGMDLFAITLGPDRTFNIPLDATSEEQQIALKNMLDYNTWLSSNLQIDEFSPANLKFKLDQISSKLVPVDPNLLINYKEGSGLTSEIEITPDSVLVTGPKSIIEKISKVETNLKEFEDIDGIINEKITLKKIDKVQFDKNELNINFEAQQIVDKVFRSIPVETQGVPKSRELQLFPGRVDVVLRGGIKILGALSEEELSAYVNFRQALIDTTGSLEPRINIPNHTIFIRSIPNRLEYIIKRY
ncbi:MAG: CdaR family protein [Rhodothermaceae bacterium]